MERYRRRGGLVGPVILIGLGIVFLLNNLGRLDWGVWDVILRLWPVLLIGLGLDLLVGRRSLLGSLLVVVIMLGIMAGVVAYYGSPARAAQLLTTQSIHQAVGGATQAEVEIDLGVGRLQLGALSASTDLIEGSVALGRGQRVVEDYRVTAGTVHYSLRTEGQDTFTYLGRGDQRRDWDLDLNPEIPMDLTIHAGVGEATVDLSGLTVTELQLDNGVGKTTLTLPSHGRAQASIRAGVGEIVIVIPHGVGVRIRASGGLTHISVPAGFQRQGDTYTSPGYETANNRVDLGVEGGIGQITIRD